MYRYHQMNHNTQSHPGFFFPGGQHQLINNSMYQPGHDQIDMDDSVEIEDYVSGDSSVDDADEFNIQIEFDGMEWTDELMSVFTNCADYLSDLITTNLSTEDGVSDLTISASLINIDGTDGTIGGSAVTDQWDETGLPSESTITLDVADAQSYLDSDLLDSVVLHEMLHSLGFGTLWEEFGLITIDKKGNVVYTGDATDINGQTPIIETDGGEGTEYSHWDEEAYDDELMTGYINDENTITDMTLAALVDLGYDLNSDAGIADVGLVGVIDGYSSTDTSLDGHLAGCPRQTLV